MKTTDFENIEKIVRGYRLVSERVDALRKMGYTVEIRPMGSGRILQVKEVRGETRIQVGYGKGRYNHAYAVILKK